MGKPPNEKGSPFWRPCLSCPQVGIVGYDLGARLPNYPQRTAVQVLAYLRSVFSSLTIAWSRKDLARIQV